MITILEDEIIEYLEKKNNEIYLLGSHKDLLVTRYDFVKFDYKVEDTLSESYLTFLQNKTKFRIFNYKILDTFISYNLHNQITHLEIIFTDLLKNKCKLDKLKLFTKLKFLDLDGRNSNNINLDNITEFLPDTLEVFILNYRYFDNPLLLNCSHLKYLSITSEYFNQSLDNLPIFLETLIIESKYFNQNIDYLPVTLKTLFLLSTHFYKSLEHLPQNLNFLVISKRLETTHNLPKKLKLLIHNSNNIIDNNDIYIIPFNFNYFTNYINYSLYKTLFYIYKVYLSEKKPIVYKYVDDLYYI